MTAQERLVMLCSSLGLTLKFDYNSHTNQFETHVDSGSTHYRGAANELEDSAKVVCRDLKNSIDVALNEG